MNAFAILELPPISDEGNAGKVPRFPSVSRVHAIAVALLFEAKQGSVADRMGRDNIRDSHRFQCGQEISWIFFF